MSYNTSFYDLLFNSKYSEEYGDWLIELKKHDSALKEIFKVLDKKAKESGEYYPLPDDVFKCFRLTPLSKVKVCFWGQDPYKGKKDNNQTCRAQGLSFSVAKDDSIPGSLQNIYKELSDNFPTFKSPDHGDLSKLAEQGVLLINNALTFCVADENLYRKLWRRFTYLIISILNEKIDSCIHVLLGKDAQELATHIRSRNIITATHPSPLSCYRGFFGSKIFIKINITLKNQEKEQIDFNKLNDEELEPTYVESLLKKK